MKKELKKIVKGLIKGDVEINDNLSAADVASDPVLLLSGRPGREKSLAKEGAESQSERSSDVESEESSKYKEEEQ